jgi:alpha-1,2-mannosyltransferase
MRDILSDMTFSDFTIYFRAAEAARANQPIYDIQGMNAQTFDPYYKYPPLAAHILKFFVPHGLRQMALVWFYLSIAFYVASLLIWIFTAKIPLFSAESLLLACMLFSSQPAVDSLSGPQMDCFMLLLLFICCWGVINNRSLFAGGSIAAATMIKIFPIVLLLPFFQMRRHRDIAFFALVVTALLLISFSLAGIEEHVEFLTGVLPANVHASAFVENQSLFGFLSRFFTDGSEWNDGRPTNLPGVLWIARIIGIVMLVTTVYLARFNRLEISIAAIVVWLLIALPVVWVHYQTLLFFPAALYLHHQSRERLNDSTGWLCFGIAWALIAFGNHSLLKDAPVWIQSYKFYGAFLLWILFTRAMWSIRQKTAQNMVVGLQ